MTHRSVEAYGKEKKKYSLKLAQLYKKCYMNNFSIDQDYNKYDDFVKATGIPYENQRNIEKVILLGNGNYRPIDIYQFW